MSDKRYPVLRRVWLSPEQAAKLAQEAEERGFSEAAAVRFALDRQFFSDESATVTSSAASGGSGK